MNIAIIDADLVYNGKHRFPNLACMKISGFYKSKGHNVDLVLEYSNKLENYDKVFISKVFTQTEVPDYILKMKNVEYGGTGFYYDKARPLPYEIEHHMPDYSLYDKFIKERINSGESLNTLKYYTDYSIGFTTRGCFRKCSFCVNKNYDKVCLHSPLDEFVLPDRKKICLLDDNVFGSPEWRNIFLQLQKTGKPFQYKQGLDERLLTKEKCNILFNSKYDGDYIFAFDNIKDKDIIIEKAKIIRNVFKTKGHNIKFYVLCAYDENNKYDEQFWINDIKNTFERIFILAKYNFKPYIMRYEKYKESPYYGVYVNFAQWCNQPSFFYNYSIRQFCEKYDDRASKGKRTSATYKYFKAIENATFKEYIDIIPKELIMPYWK